MILLSRTRNKSISLDGLLWLAVAAISIWNLLLAVAVAQNQQPRHLLDSLQIVSTMQGHHLPTDGVQVRFAAPITSISPSPQLDIQSVSLLSSREMRLRMSCTDHSQCLPFFAFATFPDNIDPAQVPASLNKKPATATHPETAPRPLPVAANYTPVKPLLANSLLPFAESPLRSGSPAALDFDGDRVHVRVQVICLESGAVGDKIRVTTRDHKQFYVAEIVTPTLLRGTF